MPVYAEKRKQFEIPPEGLLWGTLTEVTDLGLQRDLFGGEKKKLLFIFETDRVAKDGQSHQSFLQGNQHVEQEGQAAAVGQGNHGPDARRRWHVRPFKSRRQVGTARHRTQHQ